MDEPSKGLDKETSRDLNKAVNMGIVSLVGAIIPIIGLLLAIIALVMGDNIPRNKHTEGKKRTVTTIALIGIVLSLLSGAGYTALIYNSQNQLSTCLQQSEDAYWAYVKANASSATPQADGTTMYGAHQPVWDTADNNRTTAKNECYRRYPN
jgi:predicted membrane channel-forming protein YqfA (hemolysin III family)